MHAPSLTLTGERTVPGIAEENYWFRRHEAAYAFLAPHVTGVVAVEVGCGEGYGSAMLAAGAQRLLALDYDAQAIAHAASRYPKPTFVRGNLAAIPIAEHIADIVVSLQVVEHVWDHAQFVRQCVRLLHRGGTLALSTPNRLTFSPGADATTAPTNPFHTHEFTAHELLGLLHYCGLTHITTYGVFAGDRLRALDETYDGSFVAAQLAAAPPEWSSGLHDDVNSVSTADFTIREADGADIDESLDLLYLIEV